MVVQENQAPAEETVSNRSKFVVVKNHVRELLPENMNSREKLSNEVTEKSSKIRNKKLEQKEKSQEVLPELPVSSDAHISASDLDELKTIYNKCKAVLLKIETKYGHLLDLNNENSTKAAKRKYISEESESDDCCCSRKKKIIFDENGQQIEKECQLDNHICPKKERSKHTDFQPQHPAIQVEYDTREDLPENLLELENILKNPNISNRYREMVIEKAYLIRQGYLSEMRYDKEYLIRTLKENSDELLDFKGTNLSTLPGYPTTPLEKPV